MCAHVCACSCACMRSCVGMCACICVYVCVHASVLHTRMTCKYFSLRVCVVQRVPMYPPPVLPLPRLQVVAVVVRQHGVGAYTELLPVLTRAASEGAVQVSVWGRVSDNIGVVTHYNLVVWASAS
jgi:hypothetical protein